MSIRQRVLGIALIFGVLTFRGMAQETIPIVPYPKAVHLEKGILTLKKGFKIGYLHSDLAPAADLLAANFYTLYQIPAKQKRGKGTVILDYDSYLGPEAYTLAINDSKILIKGGSYNAVCMGITSLLQLAKSEKGHLNFPKCSIEDQPTSQYRGVLLDVARQWHHIATVKQVVELCRWYKIKYLQLHLSDDQSFTFPSKAYPKLATKDRHYTREELTDLVAFTQKRGVVIIPEFDAPGHTGAMRKAMPELFGDSQLAVLNMADERVYGAMETLMKEMMDVFNTSPYFHIGGDEAWLGPFEKKDTTKDYVEQKGFDNAHDVYLDFLVRMHGIVKKYGKKTLVWESFAGTGSRKVQIPKDMTVFAWETAYQRPDSLIKNGYTIINASWKPTYVTPGLRWEPEYIYHWNLHRWENHWNATPAFFQPIQLDKNIPILGGQLCSWEMAEEQEIPSLHQRVPAISEVFWNGDAKTSYEDYTRRYRHTDYLYHRLIYPVATTKKDFTEPDYQGIYYNRENQFADGGQVISVPQLPRTKITYTTDGSMPTINAPELPRDLKLDKDFKARIRVFNDKGIMIGYKMPFYQVNAVYGKIQGDTLGLRDIHTNRPQVNFTDRVSLILTNLKPRSELRYTTDGTIPTATSTPYTGPIPINRSLEFKAVCFFNGKPYGLAYKNKFVKKDYENNWTTGKPISAYGNSKNTGINMDKAVDGLVDLDGFWDNQNGATSLVVDLEQVRDLSKTVLFTYWDNNRYYSYTIASSLDGKHWEQIVDRSQNTAKASEKGYTDEFPIHKARYIKINMLKNSINNSMHIVEIRAY